MNKCSVKFCPNRVRHNSRCHRHYPTANKPVVKVLGEKCIKVGQGLFRNTFYGTVAYVDDFGDKEYWVNRELVGIVSKNKCYFVVR